MRAFNIRVAIFVAGFALAAGPALAQRAGPAGGGGDRGGGNGGGGGTANAGSGSVASTSTAGGGGSVSSSASGSASPATSGFGPTSSSPYAGGGIRQTAPEHRTSFSYSESGSPQHHASSSASSSRGASSSGSHATPRASSGSSSGSTAGAHRSATAPTGSQTGAATARSRGAATGSPNNVNGTGEVPSWSRARGNRAGVGTAVPRSPDNPPPGRYSVYGSYNPYFYDPNGFYGYYGFAGGYYGYYNPYYSPYGFGGYGLDPGFGFPYYGDPTDPFSYGEGYGTYSSRVYNSEGQGALKLKVKPRNANVYVDGYFVGQVDQFDGIFKKLTLNGGSHKVEIKADGYETAEFDVLITPAKTLTFEGDLKKLQ